MFNSPVIVIGPPRSGTTMTARVLQEWFGILMDGSPMRPNKVINPYGWYEDSRLVQANMLFLNKHIPLHAWTRRFKRFIRAMEKRSSLWGFKDPRLIPLLTYALTFFKSPTIIRCHRKKELVIKSYVEKLKWEDEKAIKHYEWSEKSLNQQLRNRVHYRLNFNDKEITEEEVLDFFNDIEVIRYAA